LKVYVLSKSDSSYLIQMIQKKWPKDILPKIKCFKAYEIEHDKRLLEYEDFMAVQVNHDTIVPFLGNPEIIEKFPSVKIDMGAVSFVCNGAKIMRPGITKFETFFKGDIVVVKDEIHEKTLAVGIALQDSNIASNNLKGSVIDNLHYVSDKFWKSHKEINC
jgi:PUA domain protein